MSRSVFRPDGTAADLSKARQTDLFVVVIKGTRNDASEPAQTLVVDLLPAGFEIETATVSKGRSTTDYSWLPELTDTTYTEQRDDRFIAALDLKNGAKDFTLAYVVRAVTPGEFKYPALVAEDMYEPETTGRTAIGKLTVGAGKPLTPTLTLPRLRGRGKGQGPRAGRGRGPRSGRVRGWLRWFFATIVLCLAATILYRALPAPSLDRGT